MTKDEAKRLKRFDHYCTCGGFAWRMNGRPEADPHMAWCPQKQQYDEWWAAMNGANAELCGGPSGPSERAPG